MAQTNNISETDISVVLSQMNKMVRVVRSQSHFRYYYNDLLQHNLNSITPDHGAWLSLSYYVIFCAAPVHVREILCNVAQ